MQHNSASATTMNPENNIRIEVDRDIADQVRAFAATLRQQKQGLGPNGLPLDPIIHPAADSDRYVLLPFKHPDIWDMHEKQQKSFWVFDEIRSLRDDLTDWNTKLSEKERYFIKMILAFFASADGIVNENLVTRFYNEVQVPEARDVYTIQMHIESVHCVHGDTPILTDMGHYRIADMAGKLVNVWNGETFSRVEVQKTSNRAEFTRVRLSNGASLVCTSKHRWFVREGTPGNWQQVVRHTDQLRLGDRLWPMALPLVADRNNPPQLPCAALLGYLFTRGAVRSDRRTLRMYPDDHDMAVQLDMQSIGNDRFLIPSDALSRLDLVPVNYDFASRMDFVRGLLMGRDARRTHDRVVLSFASPRRVANRRANDVRLLLGTLGISAYTKTRTLGASARTQVHILYDALDRLNELTQAKFALPALPLHNDTTADNEYWSQVGLNEVAVEGLNVCETTGPSYCFTELLRGAGTFNGVVTGQSETYSRIIDTYIEDPTEREQIFRSLEHQPVIAKKAAWAKKWILNHEATYGERLFAFGIVEMVFFSGAFAALFWIRSRNLLPALSQANQMIARDETMHGEFAALLFRKLRHQRCSQEQCHAIVREAVELEIEFMTQALPCTLIGMNADLMVEYIKNVADTYLEECGLPRIYGASNPFPFIEARFLQTYSNFFEKKATTNEYSKYTGDRDLDPTEDF